MPFGLKKTQITKARYSSSNCLTVRFLRTKVRYNIMKIKSESVAQLLFHVNLQLLINTRVYTVGLLYRYLVGLS